MSPGTATFFFSFLLLGAWQAVKFGSVLTSKSSSLSDRLNADSWSLPCLFASTWCREWCLDSWLSAPHFCFFSLHRCLRWLGFVVFFFFWTNIGGGRSLPRLVHAFRDLTGSRVKFHSRRRSVLAFVAETRIVGEDRGGKIYIFREIRIDLEKIEEIFFRLTLFLKSFFF